MTLVELMVSVLLVTLMAGTVLALLVQNMKMGGTIDYNYAAVNIAKSRIDRIRGLRRDQGFSNLPAIESNTRVDRNGLPDENGDFTRTTVITANFGGNANLTKIEVTVNYNTAGGVNTTTIVLTSLLSPYI